MKDIIFHLSFAFNDALSIYLQHYRPYFVFKSLNLNHSHLIL